MQLLLLAILILVVASVTAVRLMQTRCTHKDNIYPQEGAERENLPQFLLLLLLRLLSEAVVGQEEQVLEQRIAVPSHLYSAPFPPLLLLREPFRLRLTIVKSDVFPLQTFTFPSVSSRTCQKSVPELTFIDANASPL